MHDKKSNESNESNKAVTALIAAEYTLHAIRSDYRREDGYRVSNDRAYEYRRVSPYFSTDLETVIKELLAVRAELECEGCDDFKFDVEYDPYNRDDMCYIDTRYIEGRRPLTEESKAWIEKLTAAQKAYDDALALEQFEKLKKQLGK